MDVPSCCHLRGVGFCGTEVGCDPCSCSQLLHSPGMALLPRETVSGENTDAPIIGPRGVCEASGSNGPASASVQLIKVLLRT